MAEEAQSEVTEPKYKIIDNALEEADFLKLKTIDKLITLQIDGLQFKLIDFKLTDFKLTDFKLT